MSGREESPARGAVAGARADGFLLVDKPAGPTSHDVVAAARRVLGSRRVGHAGTLDPAATGLLVVLAGRATRLARFLAPLVKAYRGTIRFGLETASDDATGEPLERDESWRGLDRSAVEAALARIAARPTQVPPRISAKQVGGERAYRLTRRGAAPALAPVPVTIHALAAVGGDWSRGLLEVDVRCGAGTYVRAIARDLGRELGTRAHLAALRRVAIGPWRVEDAAPLAALEPGAPVPPLRPLADAVAHLPALAVGPEAAAALAHGRRLPAADRPAGEGPVAVFGESGLVAVVVWRDGQYVPEVVLTP